MQMFGGKNLNNKLQFAISEENVYAITNTIAFTNRTTYLITWRRQAILCIFFNDNLHEKTFFKKAETFKTSLETLLLKNFRVSFYFLDPWRDFHKISFTHAIWSSRNIREENHIHYVVYCILYKFISTYSHRKYKGVSTTKQQQHCVQKN